MSALENRCESGYPSKMKGFAPLNSTACTFLILPVFWCKSITMKVVIIFFSVLWQYWRIIEPHRIRKESCEDLTTEDQYWWKCRDYCGSFRIYNKNWIFRQIESQCLEQISKILAEEISFIFPVAVFVISENMKELHNNSRKKPYETW